MGHVRKDKMNSLHIREVTLDTETTGLNPANGDRIVEIGCVELINKVKTGNVFHTYINPCRDVPEEAFRIHGLSSDFLKDKPTFENIAKEFMQFLGDDKLVIHNATFDMRFINSELSMIGHREINFNRTVDTLIIARSKFPGAQATLDALCKRFGIDLSKRVKHGALLDAVLLADVYVELMGGNQGSMALHMPKTSGNMVSTTVAKSASTPRTSRSVAPNKAELEAHKEFLKQVKDTVWG